MSLRRNGATSSLVVAALVCLGALRGDVAVARSASVTLCLGAARRQSCAVADSQMAVRIRSQFHKEGRRTPAALASVVAMLAWKLAIDAILRMRGAAYDIDIGRPYFDFVCEFLVFMALAADRIAYRQLSPEVRAAFTTALAIRLAEIMEQNSYMLPAGAAAGERRGYFLELFNRRSGEYAE